MNQCITYLMNSTIDRLEEMNKRANITKEQINNYIKLKSGILQSIIGKKGINRIMNYKESKYGRTDYTYNEQVLRKYGRILDHAKRQIELCDLSKRIRE